MVLFGVRHDRIHGGSLVLRRNDTSLGRPGKPLFSIFSIGGNIRLLVCLSVLGGGGHEHRGGLPHHRRHLLRYRPWVLQAEGVQPQDGHGLPGR